MGPGLDLSNAISLHPLPFHIQHARDESPSTRRPPPETIHERAKSPTVGKEGASTSIEAVTADHDPVTRRSQAITDPENDASSSYVSPSDPFQLSSKIKTTTEIKSISRNSSRRNSAYTIPGMETAQARKLQNFYKDQNDNIERLLKSVDDHRRQAKEESDDDSMQFKLAVNGSFVANLALAALQIYAAASSGSLSIVTTMADAIFDPMSNITLILCNRAVNRVDPRRYPSGKARIETAGNIVFCFLMSSVSFIIIVLSARDLAAGSTNKTLGFHLPSVIAVGIAFVTKLCLFLYCFSLRHKYSQVHILWEDHRNDLMINGVGLLTSVAGSKLQWWIDPAGAIILSTIIAFLWLRTAISEFQLLIGVSADTSTLQLITYICKSLHSFPCSLLATTNNPDPAMTHSPNIVALDTVRAWHSGPRLIVEVDIVMDAQESLRDTHDVAEGLQTKLESLPDVDRAYVHVDYETSHAPEHFLKKEL